MPSTPVALFFPFDVMAHYLRCLQLAEAIRGDYDCVFLHSARYGAFVEKRGFRTVPGLALCADEVLRQSKTFRFDWLQTGALEAVFLSQCELIRALRPDVVIGDMSPTLKMAAAASRTHYISILNGYMSPYYALPRPMPTTHPLVRHTGLPPALFQPLVGLGETLAFRWIHRPFRRLREKYGLPSLQSFDRELEGDLTCIADSPLLFPQKDLPDHYRIIGPLFHRDDRPETGIREFPDPGRPTLVVNMGSTGALEKVAWLADPRFRVFNIAVAGSGGPVFNAAHIQTAAFINMTALLPHTDLVLCHGGNGTINQALAAGVPVLCLPDLFEQEWNARRIEQLGYGRIVDPLQLVESLLEIIKTWIAHKRDPRFARLARALQVSDSKARFGQVMQSVLIPR